MSQQLDDILEFHWMMDMLQTVDVGIVVLNRQFKIQVWNGFMESHSGMLPSDVRDKSLFTHRNICHVVNHHTDVFNVSCSRY